MNRGGQQPPDCQSQMTMKYGTCRISLRSGRRANAGAYEPRGATAAWYGCADQRPLCAPATDSSGVASRRWSRASLRNMGRSPRPARSGLSESAPHCVQSP